MPWCPKCKLEYRTGITVCPDCGSTLSENKESMIKETLTPVFCGDEATAERIAQFLDYSHIKSVTAGELTKNGYPVLVSEDEYDEASKLVRVFLYEEAAKKELSAEEKAAIAERQQKSVGAYVKKADKYEDMNSSALTLLGVGAAGIIFMILKITKILPISFGSASILFDIVMGFIFIFFLITGFSSLKRAKQIKSEIGQEEKATQEITDWFLSEYTAESIDNFVFEGYGDMPEELKYFRRSEFIKGELNTRLMALEESYLEDLTENLYHTLYESEA